MIISILCPTRNRPMMLGRMAESAFTTAAKPELVEILFYVDDDDTLSAPAIRGAECLARGGRVDIKIGPRIVLTQCWNELLPMAKGDLFMQGNDDIVFRTNGWDEMVRATFNRVEDKILLVHGSDEGMHYEKFGAHAIVSRRWVEAVGYFIPPYFSSDFGDKWINDVADALGRRVYLPFVVEHMHFLFGKTEQDSTTKERLARHERDRPEYKWNETQPERDQNISTLNQLSKGPFSENEVKALRSLV